MKSLLLLVSVFVLGVRPLSADEPKPASQVKNVSPEEAAKLLAENPRTIVLDVRTADEFAKGHIPGARNVDFFEEDFAKKVAALDPATPILVHCAAGNRSTKSLEFLKDKKVVYHLNNGFSAWEKAGKPVEGAPKN